MDNILLYFLSPEFMQCLVNMLTYMSGKDASGRVFIISDENVTAYSDGESITISVLNPIVLAQPTPKLKVLAMAGTFFHEVGHLLYTDFDMIHKVTALIADKGELPEPADPELAAAYLDFKETVKDSPAKRKAASDYFFDLTNSIEDIWMESALCEAYPGTVKLAITVCRMEVANSNMTVRYLIKNKLSGFPAFANLVLSYVSAGSFPNPHGDTMPELTAAENAVPYLDAAVKEDDTMKRLSLVSNVFLTAWDIIKKDLENVTDTQESKANDKATSDTSSTGKDSNSDARQSSGQDNEDEAQSSGPKQQKTSSLYRGKHSDGNEKPADNDMSVDKIADMIEKSVKDALANNTDKTKKVRKNIRENKLQKNEEKLRNMTVDANEGVSRGEEIRLCRHTTVTQCDINAYRDMKDAFKCADALTRAVRKILFIEPEGTLSRQRMGKKLDIKNLYDRQGLVFKRNIAPVEADLAVALLIDESGSMYGQRIEEATRMAVIIDSLCENLNIPLHIAGHHWDSGVVYDVFKDFDETDGKDKYRLMQIRDGGENMDGRALTFCADLLLKRPERKKLLILISDGQPSAPGYGGREAERELKDIKKRIVRSGAGMFAAAIGSDKNTIKRIYTDGYLDITDLKKLPITVSRLITAYMKG